MKNWYKRWLLRRVIAALYLATDYGLRKEVLDFAQSLEATSLMARGSKKDEVITIQTTARQLACFITYMDRLHCSKLSLLLRARIGLAALATSDSKVLGKSPEDFIADEKPKAQSGKRIQRVH